MLSSIRAVVHVSVAVEAMMTTMTNVRVVASRATAMVAVISVASAEESVSTAATTTTRIKETYYPYVVFHYASVLNPIK